MAGQITILPAEVLGSLLRSRAEMSITDVATFTESRSIRSPM